MSIKEFSKDELIKIENQYIFHGSPFMFEMCNPHQAKCDSGNKENTQFAVYGTNDFLEAVLYAFKKSPEKNYSWSAKHNENGYYAELHGETFIEEDAFGYVYCFDKQRFKPTREGTSQHVCYEQIQPSVVYKVYYKDFKNSFVKESNLEL